MRIVISSDLWISVYYDFLGVLTWHGAARYCSPWHARCAGKTDGRIETIWVSWGLNFQQACFLYSTYDFGLMTCQDGMCHDEILHINSHRFSQSRDLLPPHEVAISEMTSGALGRKVPFCPPALCC